MIFSKSALQVVELTTPDKDIPVLNCVCLEPSGMVVAMNRLVMSAVLPLEQEVLSNVPIASSGPLLRQTLFGADAIRSVIKLIPKDKLFSGLLEFCDISEDGAVTVNDGHNMHTIKINPIRVTFVDYRAEFRNARTLSPANGKMLMINRKRFDAFIVSMGKVCSYDSEFSPLYMDYGNAEYILCRVRNERTNQWTISILRRDGSNPPELSKKESLLFVTPPRRIL